MHFRKRHALIALAAAASAHAGNITLDGTIKSGFENTRLSGPNYQLSDAFGKVSGGNLLLSLRMLELDRGETARFTSTLPLKNIVTRVTGGVPSRIDGAVISDVPGAALFLINPKGIVVGPTARFETAGALHLSTADTLAFAGGNTLDLRGGNDPVLSTAAPAAFGFLARPAAISVTGASFAGPAESRSRSVFSLTGGAIALRGAAIDAPNGVISLHAGAGPGTVTVPTLSNNVTATFAGGPLTMTSRTAGGAVGGEGSVTPTSLEARNGGLIRVTGGDVNIDGARLDARSFDAAGRSISLAADRTLRVASGAAVQGGTEGAGNAPHLSLAGKTILLETDASVADEILTPKGSAGSGTRSGRGGGISLTGDDIILLTRAQVRTATGTASDGGAIDVVARKSLLIDGVTTATALTGFQTETNGFGIDAGTGGAISITAPRITITREGDVAARTVGTGNAGSITVRGGDMTLDAADLKYTGFESRAGKKSRGGSGGTIDIALTGDLLIRKGGAISASTFEPGTGGEVRITAENVYATEVGLGNIDPVTKEPFNGVFSRSTPFEGSSGGGNAGGVTITARGQIVITGGSQVGVNAKNGIDGPGEIPIRAGNVTLDAQRINVTNGKVTAESDGNGGNVILRGNLVVANDGAVLNAAAGGDGGRFTIAPTKVVVLGNDSTIDARAGGVSVKTVIDPSATFIKSPSGTILADNPTLPPDVDVAAGLLTFTVSFADATKQLQLDCASQSIGLTSSFTVEPRGGVLGRR